MVASSLLSSSLRTARHRFALYSTSNICKRIASLGCLLPSGVVLLALRMARGQNPTTFRNGVCEELLEPHVEKVAKPHRFLDSDRGGVFESNID